jgi:hypothetical protein
LLDQLCNLAALSICARWSLTVSKEKAENQATSCGLSRNAVATATHCSERYVDAALLVPPLLPSNQVPKMDTMLQSCTSSTMGS